MRGCPALPCAEREREKAAQRGVFRPPRTRAQPGRQSREKQAPLAPKLETTSSSSSSAPTSTSTTSTSTSTPPHRSEHPDFACAHSSVFVHRHPPIAQHSTAQHSTAQHSTSLPSTTRASPHTPPDWPPQHTIRVCAAHQWRTPGSAGRFAFGVAPFVRVQSMHVSLLLPPTTVPLYCTL